MNYNDKIMSQEEHLLNSQQAEFYSDKILRQSTQNSRIMVKSKQPCDSSKTILSGKGKQNQAHNLNLSNNKNIITNHSFNGFFNENAKQFKKASNQTQQQTFNPRQILQHKNQIQINLNSPVNNFNSSGKLSNLYFVNHSTDKHQSLTLNPEISNFMKKYFPINFQTGNYYGQYVTLSDFVEILFEDFHHLLGDKAATLIHQFAEKIFLLFGEQIYFDDLFQKTDENGLTGLVLEVLKAIQEDKSFKISKQHKFAKSTTSQSSYPSKKDSRIQKSKASSGFNAFKNKATLNSNNDHIQPLIIDRSKSSPDPLIMDQSCSNTSKISLDKFFGSSISKVQFYEQQLTTMTGYNNYEEQNIEQLKIILEDYLQTMYQQAQSKINKKYIQQLKKITLKYKDTQKLLQKVNDKISNYYDCIELQKNYEKKFKTMIEKEAQINKKVQSLQYELKVSKDQAEKEKLNNYKANQELEKLKEKLEKYQNAIFEKAMEKNNKANTDISSNNKTNQNASSNGSNSLISQRPIQKSRFQIRVDTFSQHRPSISPLKINNPPTYTSYFTKQTLSPINIKTQNEGQRGSSVSPIKQRISFMKTQNPSLQPKASSPNTYKDSNATFIDRKESFIGTNPVTQPTTNPYYYQSIQQGNSVSNPISNEINYSTQNSLSGNNLKVSKVERIEVGQVTQLRPLSPIGKLGQTSKGYGQQYSQNISYGHQVNMQNNQYTNQRGYSPIRVQFCSSQVSNNGGLNK